MLTDLSWIAEKKNNDKLEIPNALGIADRQTKLIKLRDLYTHFVCQTYHPW